MPSALLAPGTMASRAASKAAFLAVCRKKWIRVNSTDAKNTVKIGKATNANSTVLAPRRSLAWRPMGLGVRPEAIDGKHCPGMIGSCIMSSFL